MISQRFTCIAITAGVSLSGALNVPAQSTRVVDTASGTTITSLTQLPRTHRATTALDALQADTNASVDMNILEAPPLADAGTINDSRSRGGSGRTRANTGALFSPASPSGASPSGSSKITSFNEMTKGGEFFRVQSSIAPSPGTTLAPSSPGRQAGSLRTP